MTRYPRFRFGEVVRVARMTDCPEDTPDLRGKEGTVSGFAPTAEGSAWSVAVWLPEVEEVWSFDEDELRTAGFVEIQADGETTRVPLDPATHVDSFKGELHIRLVTEVEAEDGPRVAGAAETALRSLIRVERVTWKAVVHSHPPWRYDVALEVVTSGDSRDAFEAVVASRPTGWVRRVDDGWGCDFWWSRQSDESGEPFLAPEAQDIGLSLTPWSDPSSRPVKKGRTHDPGLPGFTPPPPAAGYEDVTDSS
jgi:hypothetical protein